ncbi:GNAT family N-acetyltransferase [Marinilactibacillus psychrotolerans]|uniref:GNAT family N-acetyltransferase n=1 Tax=Marinilactibacillus psychrotolerans TaxID=191770 RepID=UPI0039AFF3DE
MEISQIEAGNYDLYVNLFLKVFNHSPWNDEWESEKASLYLKDIFNTPGFIGMEGIIDDCVVAAIIGNRKHWWSGDEFFVQEMFIDPKYQGKGIGSSLFEQLTGLLKEKNISTLSLLTDKGIDAEFFYKTKGMVQIDRLIFLSKEVR